MIQDHQVLLVGGMGFVGRQLQRSLLDAGYTIHILDQMVSGSETKDGINFYEVPSSSESLCRELLQRCSTVFYLASSSVPTTTLRQPSQEGNLNVLPFLKYLNLVQDYNHIHLIYFSSGGTIYGNPSMNPVNESCSPAPISYHGAGKAAMEAFLWACSSQCENRITILRPSNLYGPQQPYVQGFGIIRSIFEKLMKDDGLEIWGDGEVIRDYLYIDDLIHACMACLQFSNQQNKIRVYNVSSGQRLSINQLCDEVEKVTRRRLKKIYFPERPIDVKSVVLDNSKIKKELGWLPDIGINEGLRRTWDWIRGLTLTE